MKKLFIFLVMILSTTFCYAAERAVLQDGTGVELGTTANPLQVQLSGDIEVGTNSIDGDSSGGLLFDPDNDGTNELIMSTSGGLGVNTTSPSTLVHILGSGTVGTPDPTSYPPLTVQRSGTAGSSCYANIISGNTGTTGIYFGDTDSLTVAGLFYDHNTSLMAFRANAGNRMYLSSSVFYPVTDAQISLGGGSNEFNNLYIDGIAYIDELQLVDSEKIKLGTGNDGELFVTSDDIYIKNVTSDKDVIFQVNDGGTPNTEVLRVDASVPQVTISGGSTSAITFSQATAEIDGPSTSLTIDAPSIISDGKRTDTVDARTISDTGADADPATLTLQPTTSYVTINCQDDDTCDVTMSETGANDGDTIEIVMIGAETTDFADTAGVTELNGAYAATQYQSLTIKYVSDRWIEMSRSAN